MDTQTLAPQNFAERVIWYAITLFLYTFGENLEMLAYLYWPALVIMGIALKLNIARKLPLGILRICR